MSAPAATPVKSLSILNDMLKAYFTLAKITKDRATPGMIRKRDIAFMYARNQVDRANVQLDVAMWDDWQKDVEVLPDGRVKHFFAPKLWDRNEVVNDERTLIGAALARATSLEDSATVDMADFKSFIKSRAIKFLEDVERVGGARQHVHRGVHC